MEEEFPTNPWNDDEVLVSSNWNHQHSKLDSKEYQMCQVRPMEVMKWEKPYFLIITILIWLISNRIPN